MATSFLESARFISVQKEERGNEGKKVENPGAKREDLHDIESQASMPKV